MCFKDIAKVFGGGADAPPVVIRESPIADQAKIDAEAAAKASQENLRRRRRMRASSLLATGGAGDTAVTTTETPAAKPTLGA